MPLRLSTRWAWRYAGALTTATASTRRSPPVSYSSGMSSTASGRRAAAQRSRKRRSALRTSGWTIASSWPSAAASPNTRRPSAARSMAPAESTHPGNAAPTGPAAAPLGANRQCTAASASNTGTPKLRKVWLAVDLPMAIEPVRPSTNMALARCRQSGQHGGAQIVVDHRVDPEPGAKAGPSLVQQHAEAVDHRVAARPRHREQRRDQWGIDHVGDQSRARQSVERQDQRRLAAHAEAGGIDQERRAVQR